ncbi:hypothetical protein V6584_07415 [Bifidobacterium sp. IMAU50987]
MAQDVGAAVVDDSFNRYGLDERDGVLLRELLGFGLVICDADSEEGDGLLGFDD